MSDDTAAPGEFSVTQFFPDEDYETVLSYVSMEAAVLRAGGLARSVGGQIGTTQRVIITDGGDFVVFEWEFGKGVTFPPELHDSGFPLERPRG